MTIARFKDLCIDANDAHRLGTFWAGVLGRTLADHDDGSAHLDGTEAHERVWVNLVPESKTVKHRVHFDVYARSIAELEALGASVVRKPDGEISWTVMTDPEGGEFCVVTREDPPPQRLYTLVVDAADARAQAHWWYEVLGGRIVNHRDDWWGLERIPGAPFTRLTFVNVPEPKTVKNRIHWDIEAEDPQDLVRRGARLLREPDDDISWHVLADPEGNEFCSFQPRR